MQGFSSLSNLELLVALEEISKLQVEAHLMWLVPFYAYALVAPKDQLSESIFK